MVKKRSKCVWVVTYSIGDLDRNLIKKCVELTILLWHTSFIGRIVFADSNILFTIELFTTSSKLRDTYISKYLTGQEEGGWSLEQESKQCLLLLDTYVCWHLYSDLSPTAWVDNFYLDKEFQEKKGLNPFIVLSYQFSVAWLDRVAKIDCDNWSSLLSIISRLGFAWVESKVHHLGTDEVLKFKE